MQAMQQILFSVLLKLFQSKPVQDKLAEWKTEAFAFVKAQTLILVQSVETELKSWVPIFVKAIVTAVAQSAGQLVVNTEDKITDIIPGQIDDKVLDPIVGNALDLLGKWTGISFR